jgi:uncharacterized membrane protein
MDLINVAHVHLLLNHFPTVGTVVGIALLLLAFARRNDHLLHVSFEVFFAIALITLPAYLTGVAAQALIDGRPEVSMAAATAHQDAALLAFVVMELTGLAAWIGLWQFRRAARPRPWVAPATLLLALATIGLMAQAANIGGEIRHAEIRAAADAGPAAAGVLSTAAIAAYVNENAWVWPAAETIHFVGLCLALGVLLTVNLRLLGAMKGLPFESVHRLLPWGLLGFGVNLFTGMLFFIAAADQYTDNIAFFWKVVFMLAAGANFLYLTVFRRTFSLAPGGDARVPEKLVAATSIVLWVGVIFWGRMLPFIGNAF